MQQQVVVEVEVVRPLLVFEKFLAHEQHRNAGRRQADGRGDARAAAAVPRARIARVAEPRDPLLAIRDRRCRGSPGLARTASAASNPSGHRLRASPVMSSGRSSGALALPMTSRMAMRSPSVSVVSKPAPSGGDFTIVRIDVPVLGLVERRRADARAASR